MCMHVCVCVCVCVCVHVGNDEKDMKCSVSRISTCRVLLFSWFCILFSTLLCCTCSVLFWLVLCAGAL